MPSDTAYSLAELADLADVTPRTVRYYIAQGLLPAPTGSGPGAHYTNTHLDRIRLIKKLQRAHLPLAAIRAQVAALDDREIAQLAESAPQASPSNSAVDYIRSVMGDARGMPPPTAMAAAPRLTLGRAKGDPPLAPTPARERSQWERIGLTPDIELHIRRPLTRQQNKRVDRLIAIGRELFEEESR